MCGFAGMIDLNCRTSEENLRAIAVRMTNTLRHRGPDDYGVWVDVTAGIALGHRRLSILDLSAAGRQPMVSASGRYVIVYNGEIYNFRELRRELEKVTSGCHAFRGHSDTEVMLAAFECWGIEPAISRLNGMFAFALWDRRERVLYLSRDRLGEKPLYYGGTGRTFLFASELKALPVHPEFNAQIDRDVLALYLRHNCIPGPYSIYKGIYKLPPATFLAVTGNTAPEAMPVRYWSLKEVVERGAAEPFPGTENEAAEELEMLLGDAVRLRMVADVPLGAFLSGGIDSSTVVALMQAQATRPVRTFSIGLREAGYDEATNAREVAKHLGTDHTELYVTAAEAMAVVPRLPAIYDEPFSDSSEIPTFLVSGLARQQVTVSLSGDGGDEVFGGYNRHVWGGRIWKMVGWLPHAWRRAAADTITRVRPESWDSSFRRLDHFLPVALKHRLPGYKLHKLAGVLPLSDLASMYRGLTSHWFEPESVVIGAEEPPTILSGSACRVALPGFTEQIIFLDTLTYLPDDILTKLDRASMAVGLEGRLPYLDHRVVEFAWRLPISWKIRKSQGKRLLRQVLYRYVPQKLVERPKSGFGIPLDHWLRSPLRDWAESLLDERKIRNDGFFHPEPIREKWAEHLSGRAAWQFHLWDILVFQAWLEAGERTRLGDVLVGATAC